MDTLQAIGIAILQGATELFPISSLGHAVVLPAVLGWGLDQRAPEFLPFLVLLHTGTAAALLAYFWRDWVALGLGVLGAGGTDRVRDARRLLVLIVIATIPAVVVGYGLNTLLKSLFAAPAIAAVFLAINGIMLLAGDRLRGRAGVTGTLHKPLTAMTALDAALIGVWQCGALLPGISRSGATIVGGLLRGLDHEGSAHFSFLIALPVIVGATVLEVPHLLHASVAPGVFEQAALAAVVAGITALITTAVLMRYLRSNDEMALNPFALYCLVAGVGSAAYLLLLAGADRVPVAAVPLSRMETGWWRARHLEKLAEIRGRRVDLIWLGDSITQDWEQRGPPDWQDFAPVWQRFYGDRNAVNLGFKGDNTGHLLWRMANGEIDGIQPKAAVVLIGANNMGRVHWSAPQTIAGIDAVVDDLRRRLPTTQVLLLAVLPSIRSKWVTRTTEEVNRGLAARYGGGAVAGVTYMDLGALFTRDGQVDRTAFYDGLLDPPDPPLHPSVAAQTRMAEAIEPTLAAMLGDRSRVRR